MRTNRNTTGRTNTLTRTTLAALAAGALLLTGACSNDEDGDSNTNNQNEVIPSEVPTSSPS